MLRDKNILLENFIKRSKLIDIEKGYDYDYSLVKYELAKTPIFIICKKHGLFKTCVDRKLGGAGCAKCYKDRQGIYLIGNIDDVKERLLNQDIIDNVNYTYNMSSYKGIAKKIEITCPFHGIFNISVKSRLKGNKCNKCRYTFNNFSKDSWIKRANNKQGIFYIIKCWNETEEFYKIGITFNTVKQRYGNSTFMPYNYEIIKELISGDLSYIWELEKTIKVDNILSNYIPNIKFPGHKNECFKTIKALGEEFIINTK